jgi:hypothetical protein
MQIGAVPLVEGIPFNIEGNVEVAIAAAAAPSHALAGQAQALAVAYAGWYFEAHLGPFLEPALAAAIGAGALYYSALAMAPGAWGGDLQKRLSHGNLAGAVALWAHDRLGPRRAPAPLAGGACRQAGYFHLFFINAKDSFLTGCAYLYLQIGAALAAIGGFSAAPKNAPKKTAEYVGQNIAAKQILKVGKLVGVKVEAAAAHSSLAKLVVLPALFSGRQYPVGFCRFLATLFGLFVPRVLIWVVLHC